MVKLKIGLTVFSGCLLTLLSQRWGSSRVVMGPSLRKKCGVPTRYAIYSPRMPPLLTRYPAPIKEDWCIILRNSRSYCCTWAV